MDVNSELALLGGSRAVQSDPGDIFTWPVITKEIEDSVLEVLRAGKMSDLDVTEKFSARIPFCVVEVREKGFEEKLSEYKDMGCAGVGEHTSKIPIDHKLNLKLYKRCGRPELPILIHMAI